MKKYLYSFYILLFCLFGFLYTSKVLEISKYNDEVRNKIDEYASSYNFDCIEGSINSDGVVLGYSGIHVDKSLSYSNMKGIGFDKNLLEYKNDECILNKDSNKDKYIVSGNNIINNISIVIDVNDGKYINSFESVAEKNEVILNYLMTVNYLVDNLNNIKRHDNILFKGQNKDDLKNFYRNLHNEFYCVKYSNYDTLNVCEKMDLNSINPVNYFDKNILSNVKKILNKGVIIFIKENKINLNEFSSVIKYIKSRGYNIVSINDLLL